MGKLVNGEWIEDPKRGHDDSGGFSDQVTPVDANQDYQFPAEPNRYHLYISRACPWAHRTALVRRLKGLEEVISIDIVDPIRKNQGWEFTPTKDGCTPDSVGDAEYLRDVYTRADPDYTGRVTVPVLFDTQSGTIVNNESAEIARMFDQAFHEYATRDVPLYPESYRSEIDDIIDAVHQKINRGVYRAGFAKSQKDYEVAVNELFESLYYWDGVLGGRRFLAGDVLTLADVFLFPTLFRFDTVYYLHFKCNRRRLTDFENLWPYAREIYQLPGVTATCNTDHVKAHYYRSHEDINPTGFVPVGPEQDWTAPHEREKIGGALPNGFA